MSSFPGSPYVLKGGIVLLNPVTLTVQKVINLQYNPESISRSLQVQGTSGEGAGHRSEPLRLTGPPIETIKLDAEIDATDGLEQGDQTTSSVGIQPQLAAMESLIYPASAQLIVNTILSAIGTIEVSPMEAPLTLFVWSKNRVMPMRITDFSVTEEAFDVNLNPLRAKVSLGMRVLSMDDLGMLHPGSALYLSYQMNKERLASLFSSSGIKSLGINSIL